MTYRDLLREVSQTANALMSMGVRRGDVVTIYMGMVPELAIAMLARCTGSGLPNNALETFASRALIHAKCSCDTSGSEIRGETAGRTAGG